MKFWRTLVVCLALVSWASSENLGSQSPLTIRPLPQIDEHLFLLRALEETYTRWPNAQTERDQLAPWIAWTRQRVSRIRAAIRVNGLDPDVGTLYDDCLHYLDVYEAFLQNLGAIERQTREQAGADTLASIWKGYQTGAEVQDTSERRGTPRDKARDDGQMAAVIGGFSEAYARTKQRDAAQQEATAAEQRKLVKAWTETEATAAAIADKLARKYRWNANEAGFDGFRGASLNDYVARRPRDPFPLIRLATTRVKNETAADVLRDAGLCVRAAELVPAGRVYDPYRLDFLSQATDLAVIAVNKEASSYSEGPGPAAARALEISQAYRDLDPQDPSGRAHMMLARTLAFSHRFDDAIVAANVARKTWDGDLGFRYRYAKLMSLTNRLEAAADWLVLAYQAGWTDINDLRVSPDFSRFRDERRERFLALSTPSLGYKVDFGTFMDDVVLQNRSPFDLTNVRAKLFIRKGQQTWNREISCALIKIGATCTATNIVSIPGSAYDEASVSFTCDQDRK